MKINDTVTVELPSFYYPLGFWELVPYLFKIAGFTKNGNPFVMNGGPMVFDKTTGVCINRIRKPTVPEAFRRAHMIVPK